MPYHTDKKGMAKPKKKVVIKKGKKMGMSQNQKDKLKTFGLDVDFLFKQSSSGKLVISENDLSSSIKIDS